MVHLSLLTISREINFNFESIPAPRLADKTSRPSPLRLSNNESFNTIVFGVMGWMFREIDTILEIIFIENLINIHLLISAPCNHCRVITIAKKKIENKLITRPGGR